MKIKYPLLCAMLTVCALHSMQPDKHYIAPLKEITCKFLVDTKIKNQKALKLLNFINDPRFIDKLIMGDELGQTYTLPSLLTIPCSKHLLKFGYYTKQYCTFSNVFQWLTHSALFIQRVEKDHKQTYPFEPVKNSIQPVKLYSKCQQYHLKLSQQTTELYANVHPTSYLLITCFQRYLTHHNELPKHKDVIPQDFKLPQNTELFSSQKQSIIAPKGAYKNSEHIAYGKFTSASFSKEPDQNTQQMKSKIYLTTSKNLRISFDISWIEQLHRLPLDSMMLLTVCHLLQGYTTDKTPNGLITITSKDNHLHEAYNQLPEYLKIILKKRKCIEIK